MSNTFKDQAKAPKVNGAAKLRRAESRARRHAERQDLRRVTDWDAYVSPRYVRTITGR